MRMGGALSGLLAAALLLTGCGSGDEPKAGPRPTSSPSPTAPPGLDAAPPDRPADQAATAKSSLAYAHWFARLVQYAIEVRDSRPVNAEAFDQASCTTCRKLATFISELRQRGYWQRSDQPEIGKLTSTSGPKGTRVRGGFVYPRLEDVKVDGTVAKTLPATPYRLSVDLTWDDSASRWRVLDYTFERKSG
jgi:hypothetical protein